MSLLKKMIVSQLDVSGAFETWTSLVIFRERIREG